MNSCGLSSCDKESCTSIELFTGSGSTYRPEMIDSSSSEDMK